MHPYPVSCPATDITARDETLICLHAPAPKGLQLTFAGASYPSVVGSEPLPQHFHMNLLCKASVSDVTFVSYNGTDLFLDWEAPAGCTFKTDPGEDTKEPSNGGDDGSGSGEKEKAVGSGLGYFFLL